ncbi:MAG: DCC1-like thiol-disulfide oxidoreductase family protein [Marinoscillum sp.]
MGSTDEVNDHVILFDGVCNLCNSSVNFIIDRDNGHFRFASLQSGFAKTQLGLQNSDTGSLDSIVVLKRKCLLYKSDAALEIARHLSGGWKLLYGFKILPKPFRDWFYDLIARNRYRWFGKRDSCRIPTPELKERFLDSGDLM